MKDKFDKNDYIAGINPGYRTSAGCAITFQCWDCKLPKNVQGRKPVYSATTGKIVGHRCASCRAEKAARLKSSASGGEGT